MGVSGDKWVLENDRFKLKYTFWANNSSHSHLINNQQKFDPYVKVYKAQTRNDLNIN